MTLLLLLPPRTWERMIYSWKDKVVGKLEALIFLLFLSFSFTWTKTLFLKRQVSLERPLTQYYSPFKNLQVLISNFFHDPNNFSYFSFMPCSSIFPGKIMCHFFCFSLLSSSKSAKSSNYSSIFWDTGKVSYWNTGPSPSNISLFSVTFFYVTTKQSLKSRHYINLLLSSKPQICLYFLSYVHLTPYNKTIKYRINICILQAFPINLP